MHDNDKLGALAVIAGRCITNDGVPSLTVNIIADTETNARAMHPTLADSLTHVFAAAPDMLAALGRIASEPCDHGPGFCPRDHAKTALAAIGVTL